MLYSYQKLRLMNKEKGLATPCNQQAASIILEGLL